ncbi:high-potential iron-sulfur protein [Novosphingobium sp. ZW T3_23]|uniref:high-potential iron-sulfur protein n=1 Tax=Novosphingobium sp. ZW T3_23 TaxID=3378084 RepID=UPI003852CFBF
MKVSTRRDAVRLLALSAAAALSGQARAQAPAACTDPASLSLSQRSRRRALGYLSPAPDPQKRCGACAFFTASGAGCGACQMLSGAAVEAAAVCNSFARKG